MVVLLLFPMTDYYDLNLMEKPKLKLTMTQFPHILEHPIESDNCIPLMVEGLICLDHLLVFYYYRMEDDNFFLHDLFPYTYTYGRTMAIHMTIDTNAP